MFVLIWATLLFSVRNSNAGVTEWGRQNCDGSYCITLTDGEITSEAGLCVVIPCSFTTYYWFTPQNLVWYKCEPRERRCGDSDIIFHTNKFNRKVQPEFSGRVSLLEPDVSLKNCSIIINDLREADSGSYQLRVNGVLNGKSDGITFSSKATVSIKGLSQKPTVMIPPLTAGQQSTLTCTAPGLCSGSDPKITWMWRGTGEKDSHITGNITDFKTENVTAVTQRHSSTLTFNSSAEHHSTNFTCQVSFTGDVTTEETVTLRVTYVKEVKITGNTSVKEGETLNLTCSVESFPPSLITWTKLGFNTKLHNGTELKNDPGSATLIISGVTAEHSGQYICTAKHLDTTVRVRADVTVTWFSKILNNSGCEVQSEVLTCVCISEGFPFPTIKWPLLKTQAEYSVITTVSNYTVNSTVILTVNDHHSSSVECVSSNENGEAKENLTTRTNLSKQDGPVQHYGSDSGVLLWGVAGVSLSVNIFYTVCVVFLCKARKKLTPNQEDRTYMSLQKRDSSLEYDVIGQSLN